MKDEANVNDMNGVNREMANYTLNFSEIESST